ncbi:unnamed protein product [Fraxinus pennsylvanica]|uniref:Cytochrome P450 n=1 Tax=Fraxinus pennsylvanica TaxID=56036 RepID=A0AAD2AC65_9LAMI|nr:unnamed protein product [Fraxinus pennsylvanica]
MKKEMILRQQGFKGNSYTFRRLLFGDAKENAKVYEEALSRSINVRDETQAVPRIVPFIHKTIEKYGDKSFFWAGLRPKVLIMDPELTKTVLVKHTSFLRNFSVTNHIVKELITGLPRTEGEEWYKRRVIMNPAFHVENLKQMIPVFQKSSDDVLNQWKKLISEDGSCTVDVYPYFEYATSKVISETLFASDYSKDKRLYDLIKEMVTMARLTTRIADLPGSKYLPTETNQKSRKITNEQRKIVGMLIREREKAIREGKVLQDNLLDLLLKSELKRDYGEEEILGQVKLFFFAGYETTRNLLVWTLVLLGTYQDWQERARQEAFRVFENRKADYQGLNQLKVLSMIMNEVLRLYPPVVELSRLVEEETQLGEYIIPADTQLMVPIVMIHRDPRYWGEDANEFNPNRFAEGVPKSTKGHLIYYPFGWGPRSCIGQNYALLEAKLVLVDILRNFSFEISPTYRHAPVVMFTLEPQYGAPLILRNLE